MRIPSGKTDQLLFFVALDSSDLITRKTGLTTFTVYRSRNGATATIYTTPTVAELSTANMPGVYALTIDEDTTIASGSDSEEYCVHITQASMAPVTRVVELYRRDTTTGNTALVDSNGRVDVIKVAGTTQTAGDIYTKVTNLPSDPADASDIAALFAAVPTANANADALLDRAAGVETGLTFRQAMRLALAALAGKVSGGGTGTETFRNAVADSKNRIVATVDVSGNRSAITTDLT